MKNLKLISLVFIVFSLSGCNKDITIIGSKTISKWFVPFTQVLFKTVKQADGTSQGLIKLQVFNENNAPISGLNLSATPTIASTSFVNCTISDAQGVIYCFFTATVAGTTVVDFTDGTNNFQDNVRFIEIPIRLSVMRVSNTKILKQTTAGNTTITGLRKTTWNYDSSGVDLVHTEAPIYVLDFTSEP